MHALEIKYILDIMNGEMVPTLIPAVSVTMVSVRKCPSASMNENRVIVWRP